MFVRIIATPPGEAPEEVRQEWVGLVLPLAAGEIGPRTVPTGGVLTGPRTLFGKLWRLLSGEWLLARGYVIDAPQALMLLAEKAPSAARWWRECAPHCWKPGFLFVFHAEVCVEVPTLRSDWAGSSFVHRPLEEFYPARPVELTPKPGRRHGFSDDLP